MLRRIKLLAKYRTRNPWLLLNGSKWVAAGLIIFRQDGNLLLIKHRWRGEWEYPVGTTEGDESPLQAAQREAAEEVGLSPTDYRLIGVDFFHRRTPNGNLVFTFSAQVTRAQAAKLQLESFEITEHRWVTRKEAQELIAERLKDRFESMLQAYDAGTTVYLQDGHHVAK